MVALGMTGYVRMGFSLRTFGLEALRLEPSTILAPNHRSDNDVPVLVSALARTWTRAVSDEVPWPTFAADDHAFFRGFLAGYPEAIPLGLRRVLWPLRVGGVLERGLQCVPVRRPMQMRAVELLRYDPARRIDGQVPADIRCALAQRARLVGVPAPVWAADALRGTYADILWREVQRDQTSGCDEFWRAHLRSAVADFRRLAVALRSGGVVVIFPEGELMTDGQIGPLAPGLVSLARRGRARHVQPVAIAYDPLTWGRPRAYVSVGSALTPDPALGHLSDRVSDGLRRAVPLTVGQIAATVLRGPATKAALWRAAAERVDRAQAEGRPIEPALLGRRRHAALAVAFRRAQRLGAEDRIVRALAEELRGVHAAS